MSVSKKWIEANRYMFDSVIGKTVTVKLNGVIIGGTSTLDTIQPTVLGELENAPEKRSREDKMYTPPCFSLLFGANVLVFAIEDTVITATIHNGVRLTVGSDVVELEVAHENNYIA